MARNIYEGRIIRVEVAHVQLPNGVAVDLDLVRHPGAAAVVAATTDDVVLIRQYRFASGGYLWEIPAGTLHPGEAPEDCARRELEEEAGLAADELHRLGTILTTPGFCDERIHLYLARELRPLPPRHEADEVIAEVRYVPYHAARTLGIGLQTPPIGAAI